MDDLQKGNINEIGRIPGAWWDDLWNCMDKADSQTNTAFIIILHIHVCTPPPPPTKEQKRKISWKFLMSEWHHSQWPILYRKIFSELSRMMNSWYTCGAVTRTIELSTISVTILCNGPTSQMLHNCLEPTGDRIRLKSHSTPDWWWCIACFCMLFRNTCP